MKQEIFLLFINNVYNLIISNRGDTNEKVFNSNVYCVYVFIFMCL